MKIGDAIGIWAALFNRFCRQTDLSIRDLKAEWNSLSMTSTRMHVDEFASHVVKKSKYLSFLGVRVSEREEALVLLNGLSQDFQWMKDYYRIPQNANFSFDDISSIAVDYASDKGMLRKKFSEEKAKTVVSDKVTNESVKQSLLSVLDSSSRSPGSLPVAKVKDKSFCFDYNSLSGCSKDDCKWEHRKVDAATVNDALASVKKWKEKRWGKGKAQSVVSDPVPVPAPPDHVHLALIGLNHNQMGWYFDSGATHHLTNSLSDLCDIQDVPAVNFVVANGQDLVSKKKGSVRFGDVTISDVYFCPDTPLKLLSEGTMLSKGMDILKSSKDSNIVVSRGGLQVLKGKLVGNLFRLVAAYTKGGYLQSVVSTTVSIPGKEWTEDEQQELKNCDEIAVYSAVAFNSEEVVRVHQTYGHLNFKSCCKMLDMVEGPFPICSDCQMSNLNRLPAPKSSVTRASKPLYRLFMDLSGRKSASLAGYRYYLIIVDDYSRYRWVRWLKLKSDVYDKIVEFLALVERQFPDLPVAFLRTDGGGEFKNKRMTLLLQTKGIQAESSAPYCQFQNGVSERSIDIVDRGARAMMSHAGSPTYDWPFAVAHSVYVRNYIIAEVEKESPSTLLTGIKRETSIVGIFGCLCYAKVYVKRKADPKARRTIFLGFSDEQKSVMVRDISVERARLSEYYARDVRLDPTQFPYRSVLVPRPTVPPLDREDLKEIKGVEEQLEAHELVEHEVKDEGIVPMWR